MEFRHVPVLLDECLEGLSIKPDGIYVDGTLGGGGHASAVCERLSGSGTLIGIDRDRDAIDAAGKRLENYPCRKIFVNRNYSDIKEILKDKGITVQELADMLEISRQALSKQIQGKMLVETAQRIADKLEVPMWQLFASPEEVKNSSLTVKCPKCQHEFEVELKTKQ